MNTSPGVSAFLTASGIPAEHRLEPLTGGANNRVYRISAGKQNWVLKQYFKREHDPRDRFAAEHDYYAAIWSSGVRQTPKPIAWDRAANLGLFEHIAGRKLEPDEVTKKRIDEALEFIIQTNQKAGKATLNPASEACFSLEQHLATVDRRIDRLQQITDGSAKTFVEKELSKRWLEITSRSSRSGTTELTADQRCISPSDFGFHNALLQPDDTLKFFDFEYAGADDPAKLVCDFFCQPRLPSDLDHWDYFVECLTAQCRWNEAFGARARNLLPVYQIKWCCIMLNEFLRTDSERRLFSTNSTDLESQKARQLEQAKVALSAIA